MSDNSLSSYQTFGNLTIPAANEELISNVPVIVRKRVAFGDCDPAGIVYTPRFADYLIVAQSWLREVLFDQPLPVELPMRGMTLDFRLMMRAGDRFDMRCDVTEIRRRMFTIKIVGVGGDGLVTFVGTLSPIAYDQKRRCSVDLPKCLRDRLYQYQEICRASEEA
ncbi:acyl-CoA thioesterase [Acidocella sp.]|uniref:acyl-CoA thioesterase n=1 Tax=Acidocella sp. TaxID=50710 RepID=UPI003D051769